MLVYVKVDGSNLTTKYDSVEQARACVAELKLLKRVTNMYIKRLKKVVKEHQRREKEYEKARGRGILAWAVRRLICGKPPAVDAVDEEADQLDTLGELLDNIELELCGVEAYIIRKRAGA